LLDADADRSGLELRLIKPLPKDRARVHPFAGSGGSWRRAELTPYRNASFIHNILDHRHLEAPDRRYAAPCHFQSCPVNLMRQSFGVCGDVFSIPIDYTARRAAGQEAYTSLTHSIYLFHYHQMRFIVRATAT
jgi:hypothetical protein